MTIKLNKADILLGKDSKKEIVIEELNGSITIRPLTDSQWQDVKAVMQAGVQVESKLPEFKKDKDGKPIPVTIEDLKDILQVRVDTEEYSKAASKANILICHYGLGESAGYWTIEEVKNIKIIGLVEKLATHILELTGVTKEGNEFIEPFRTN